MDTLNAQSSQGTPQPPARQALACDIATQSTAAAASTSVHRTICRNLESVFKHTSSPFTSTSASVVVSNSNAGDERFITTEECVSPEDENENSSFNSLPQSISANPPISQDIHTIETEHSISSAVKGEVIPAVLPNAIYRVSEDSLPSENKGCFLWAADVRQMSDLQLAQLLATEPLSSEERKKVTSFYFPDDKKRALLSVLLQRSLIRHHFDVTDQQYAIERTKENKPFAKSPVKSIGKWNYNVSHQGDYVAIASHGYNTMGIDLVEISSRNYNVAKNIAEYMKIFDKQFSASEVGYVLKGSASVFSDMRRDSFDICEANETFEEDFKYQKFFINWALKEAFAKAIGQGLYFDLKEAMFTIYFDQYRLESSTSIPTSSTSSVNLCQCSGYATLTLHNQLRDDWMFHFRSVDSKHVAAIARGPASIGHGGRYQSGFAKSKTAATALDASRILVGEYPTIVMKSVSSLAVNGCGGTSDIGGVSGVRREHVPMSDQPQ